MVKPFQIKAYAKINWFLSVGKIHDPKHTKDSPAGFASPRGSFHEVHTLYHLIDLYDEITVCPGETLRVIMEAGEIPEEENLVNRGLRFLQEHVELPKITLTLKKRIPMQAGLGGGSSDAGTVLWCLRNVIRLPVPDSAFWEIACVLGSDVPFFFLRVPAARGTGRGDVLQPTAPLPPKILVLAKPEAGVSTADAYRRLDEAGGGTALPFPSSFDIPYNDFDKVAPPESRNLMMELKEAGARHAHLCGSGSAVFGEFASHELALQAIEHLQAKGLWTHLCQTLTSVEGAQWMDSF
jgi:4-diphosphocytidyl-2-C-methyl-D-erythritol kinase